MTRTVSDPLLPPGSRVWAYLRVSSEDHAKRLSLRRQLNLRRELPKRQCLWWEWTQDGWREIQE